MEKHPAGRRPSACRSHHISARPAPGCRSFIIAIRSAATSSSSFARTQPEPDADGNPVYLTLVKRLIGMPGDHIHLHDGTVFINGVAQPLPTEGIDTPPLPPSDHAYVDDFPVGLAHRGRLARCRNSVGGRSAQSLENGDIVVPPGKYFMMGDHRHASLDSRFWGFVPRENIMGRPLFNYWSFKTPHDQEDKKGLEIKSPGSRMSHPLLHRYPLEPHLSSRALQVIVTVCRSALRQQFLANQCHALLPASRSHPPVARPRPPAASP